MKHNKNPNDGIKTELAKASLNKEVRNIPHEVTFLLTSEESEVSF